MRAMAFAGFGPDVAAFYAALEDRNTREWWTEHRAVYDEQVAGPVRELAVELAAEFGPVKVFRPYRDVRFSADKTPYKTEAGMSAWTTTAGLYAAVGADGLFVAGGMYQAATDQARRLRAAAAQARTGPALSRAVRELRRTGWEVDGAQLQRIPKPWDGTHPRAELLRFKTLTGSRMIPWSARLHTAAAADALVSGWRELGSLNRWLERHVGPSDRPRPARPGESR